MEGAHQREIVEVGSASARPVLDVMGVQEPLRLTPGERASLVSYPERPFDPRRRSSINPSDTGYLAELVVEVHLEPAVTRQTKSGF